MYGEDIQKMIGMNSYRTLISRYRLFLDGKIINYEAVDFYRVYFSKLKNNNIEPIYDVAKMMKEEYGNIPWYVSENGLGILDEERFMDESVVIQMSSELIFCKNI